MLIMYEEGTRGGICQQHIDMLKQTINTWKIMIKIKNQHT